MAEMQELREKMHEDMIEQIDKNPIIKAYMEVGELYKNEKWKAIPVYEEFMEYPLEDILDLYSCGPTSALAETQEKRMEMLDKYKTKISEMTKADHPQQPIFLWPEGRMPQKTVYTDNNGHKYIHNPGFVPRMYEVLVAEDITPKGAVICCAGGEQDDNVVPEGLGTAMELRDRGYQCFVLLNRVNGGPWCPEDVGADVARAIRFIRANADKYRIPSDRVAFAGFSNGGLTGEVNIQYYSKDQNMTDYYPDYVPDELDVLKGSPDAYICIYGPRFKGMDFEYDRAEYPPTFIAVGLEDHAAIPNLRWYWNDLMDHGITAEVHTFTGTPHGAAGLAYVKGYEPNPNFALWTELADHFMQNVYSNS